MDKYTEEQREIYKSGKAQILKLKLIMLVTAIIGIIIGLIVMKEINGLIGIFILAGIEGTVLPMFDKKIKNIRYSMNFDIEELQKLKLQDKMNEK